MIDALHRDKGIDKEILFTSLETALISASHKKFGQEAEIEVTIDRATGKITALREGEPINPDDFGRIAAQCAKQVMLQKIREAECDVLSEEFRAKSNEIISGTVVRFERGNLYVNLSKAEGRLSRRDQVFSESYQPGDRIRSIITGVEKRGQKVEVQLSRSAPNFVRELFMMEVPEISDHVVEIKDLVREAGHRTKVAVYSSDSKVDCVGTCVGVRGTRIRSIIEELNGEKIDIVRWNESPEIFIKESLQPAEIAGVDIYKDERKARVIVPDDQLSLAIGKKGQNVRLTSKLTGWQIDILTETELKKKKEIDKMLLKQLTGLPGVTEDMLIRMQIAGFQSLSDIIRKGADTLTKIRSIGPKKAQAMFAFAEVTREKEKAREAIEEEEKKAARAEAKAKAEEAKKAAAAQAAQEKVTAAAVLAGTAKESKDGAAIAAEPEKEEETVTTAEEDEEPPADTEKIEAEEKEEEKEEAEGEKAEGEKTEGEEAGEEEAGGEEAGGEEAGGEEAEGEETDEEEEKTEESEIEINTVAEETRETENEPDAKESPEEQTEPPETATEAPLGTDEAAEEADNAAGEGEGAPEEAGNENAEDTAETPH